MSVEYVGVGSPAMYSPCTRRRSSRAHKPTEKMVEYTRELQKEGSSTSEDESVFEVEKQKEEEHESGCIMVKEAGVEKEETSKEREEEKKDEWMDEKEEREENSSPNAIIINTPLAVRDMSEKSCIDGKPEISTTQDQTLEAIEAADELLEDINDLFGDSENNFSHLGNSTCTNSKKSNEIKLEKELSVYHEKTKQLQETLNQRDHEIHKLKEEKKRTMALEEELEEELGKHKEKAERQEELLNKKDKEIQELRRKEERIQELEDKSKEYKEKQLEEKLRKCEEELSQHKEQLSVRDLEVQELKLKAEEIQELNVNVRNHEGIEMAEKMEERLEKVRSFEELLNTKDLEIKGLKEREETLKTVRRELAGLKGEVSHLKDLLNGREQMIHKLKEEACQKSIEQTEAEEQHKIHLKTLNEKLKTLSDTVKKNKEVLLNQSQIESQLKEEINKGHSDNKRLVGIISDLETKEMASCRNVNDLVSQVRSREEEMENKDEEIEKITEKLNKEREMVRILQESIEQTRDENTKVKNKMKEFRENDTGDTQFKHFYENDFVNFKKYVSDQFNKLKVSISSFEKDKMEKVHSYPVVKPTNGNRIAIDLDSGEIEEMSVDDSRKPRHVDDSRKPRHVQKNATASTKGKKTMLFSTSITRNIDVKELNDGLYEGSVELQMFSSSLVHVTSISNVYSYLSQVSFTCLIPSTWYLNTKVIDYKNNKRQEFFPFNK